MIKTTDFQYPDWAPPYLLSLLQNQVAYLRKHGESSFSTDELQKIVVVHQLCSHANMEKIWARLRKKNEERLNTQPWRHGELEPGGFWSEKFAHEVFRALHCRTEWYSLTPKQKSKKYADLKCMLEKLADEVNKFPVCGNIFWHFTEEELVGARNFLIGEELRDELQGRELKDPDPDEDPYFRFEITAPSLGDLLLRIASEMTEEPETIIKQPGNKDAELHFFVRFVGDYTKGLFDGKPQYGLLRDLAEVFFPNANLVDEKRIRDILK